MTAPIDSVRSPRHAFADSWRAFWFAPEPAYTLGLVRMAFGVLVVAWTLAILPDVRGVFGEHGVTPRQQLPEYQWSVFRVWPGDVALTIGWSLLVASAIALTVGWHSRAAALTVFVLISSFHRTGTYVYNAGDSVVTVIALVFALCSCGAALSLDQRRRTGSFWSASVMAPWAVRLLQVHVTLIYLVSVQAKLSGKGWTDGTAVYYAWNTDGRWATVPAPGWLVANPVLVNAATWATLLVELSIAVLVWNRRCRPVVLACGVLLHITLMLTLNVGFFSFAMYVLYLAFVPWDVVRSLPGRVTARWQTARHRGAPAP